MKILFCNIRGLGNAGRRKLLAELVTKYSFDCICLQETIKTTFRQGELDRFASQKEMAWSWLPCSGHSGVLLMGVDKEMADVTGEEFFQSLKVKMKVDGFEWEILNIYGPAHDDRKRSFLEEIQNKVLACELPIILGGDFNLVRNVEEKSSSNVDFPLIEAFNDMINDTSLQRSGSRYTWSNKQNSTYHVCPRQSVGLQCLGTGKTDLSWPLFSQPHDLGQTIIR